MSSLADRIFANPAWLPIRAARKTFTDAPAELLSESLRIALGEMGVALAQRAEAERRTAWLAHSLKTAHGLLLDGHHARALALVAAAIQPTQAVAT